MIPKVKYYGPQIPSTYAVNMTAAASGSSGITVADDNDIDFGTASFGAHWEGSRDSWRPASAEEIYTKHQDASNYVSLICNTDGTVRLLAVVAGVTILDETSSAAVATTYNGKNLKLTFSCSRETASAAGSFQPYIDAAVLGAAQSITAASPTSISNSGALYIAGTDSKRFASNTISFVMLNFAPTASEVLDLCTNGIPASWKWGSQTPVYTSNFSVGSDSWVAGSGNTFTGNVDAINGSDNWARIERTSTSGGMSATRTSTSAAGYKRQTIRIFNPSGSAITHVRVSVAADVVSVLPAVISTPANTEVFVTVYYQTISANATLRVVACDSSGTSTVIGTGNPIYFKDIVYGTAGSTLALAPTGLDASGLTWTDSSGNGNNGTLPAAGATKVTIRK